MNANTGAIFNIGGGNRITVNELISLIEELTGKNAIIEYVDSQKGDVDNTWANINKAKLELGWASKFDIRKGLANEIEWIKNIL